MIAAAKKKHSAAFPRTKIERVLHGVLPKGQTFELQAEDSGINDKKVVRVITPAWRTLRNAERISRVLKALDGQLSEAEQDRILRFSVLTPKEFAELGLEKVTSSVRRLAARKSVVTRAAVRNTATKAKRSLAK